MGQASALITSSAQGKGTSARSQKSTQRPAIPMRPVHYSQPVDFTHAFEEDNSFSFHRIEYAYMRSEQNEGSEAARSGELTAASAALTVA